MTPRVWICEDNRTTGKIIRVDLKDLPVEIKFCSTVEQALNSIPAMADHDVVTLDSEMPASRENDLSDNDVNAGVRIGLHIRKSGKNCLILWHSGKLDFDDNIPGELQSLGVRKAALNELASVVGKYLTTQRSDDNRPDDVAILQTRARALLEKLESHQDTFDPWSSLLILCGGFLFGLGTTRRLGDEYREGNPVLAEIGDAAKDLGQLFVVAHEIDLDRLEHLVGEGSFPGWFDAALTDLQGYEESLRRGRLPQDLAEIRRDSREGRRLEEIRNADARGLLTLLREGGPAEDVDPYLIAVESVGELCRFLFESKDRGRIASVTASSLAERLRRPYELVRRAYFGLQLLAMVHL